MLRLSAPGQRLSFAPFTRQQNLVGIGWNSLFVAMHRADEHLHRERADLCRVVIDTRTAEFGMILQLHQSDMTRYLPPQDSEPANNGLRVIAQQRTRLLMTEPGRERFQIRR